MSTHWGNCAMLQHRRLLCGIIAVLPLLCLFLAGPIICEATDVAVPRKFRGLPEGRRTKQVQRNNRKQNVSIRELYKEKTIEPTFSPTSAPIVTNSPTNSPTNTPTTLAPTSHPITKSPTKKPTKKPTSSPTTSPQPSVLPTMDFFKEFEARIPPTTPVPTTVAPSTLAPIPIAPDITALANFLKTTAPAPVYIAPPVPVPVPTAPAPVYSAPPVPVPTVPAPVYVAPTVITTIPAPVYVAPPVAPVSAPVYVAPVANVPAPVYVAPPVPTYVFVPPPTTPIYNPYVPPPLAYVQPPTVSYIPPTPVYFGPPSYNNNIPVVPGYAPVPGYYVPVQQQAPVWNWGQGSYPTVGVVLPPPVTMTPVASPSSAPSGFPSVDFFKDPPTAPNPWWAPVPPPSLLTWEQLWPGAAPVTIPPSMLFVDTPSSWWLQPTGSDPTDADGKNTGGSTSSSTTALPLSEFTLELLSTQGNVHVAKLTKVLEEYFFMEMLFTNLNGIVLKVNENKKQVGDNGMITHLKFTGTATFEPANGIATSPPPDVLRSEQGYVLLDFVKLQAFLNEFYINPDHADAVTVLHVNIDGQSKTGGSTAGTTNSTTSSANGDKDDSHSGRAGTISGIVAALFSSVVALSLYIYMRKRNNKSKSSKSYVSIEKPILEVATSFERRLPPYSSRNHTMSQTESRPSGGHSGVSLSSEEYSNDDGDIQTYYLGDGIPSMIGTPQELSTNNKKNHPQFNILYEEQKSVRSKGSFTSKVGDNIVSIIRSVSNSSGSRASNNLSNVHLGTLKALSDDDEDDNNVSTTNSDDSEGGDDKVDDMLSNILYASGMHSDLHRIPSASSCDFTTHTDDQPSDDGDIITLIHRSDTATTMTTAQTTPMMVVSEQQESSGDIVSQTNQYQSESMNVDEHQQQRQQQVSQLWVEDIAQL